jgi:hypothetical protein
MFTQKELFELNEAIDLSAPLTGPRAPLARWQRKAAATPAVGGLASSNISAAPTPSGKTPVVRRSEGNGRLGGRAGRRIARFGKRGEAHPRAAAEDRIPHVFAHVYPVHAMKIIHSYVMGIARRSQSALEPLCGARSSLAAGPPEAGALALSRRSCVVEASLRTLCCQTGSSIIDM